MILKQAKYMDHDKVYWLYGNGKRGAILNIVKHSHCVKSCYDSKGKMYEVQCALRQDILAGLSCRHGGLSSSGWHSSFINSTLALLCADCRDITPNKEHKLHSTQKFPTKWK